MMIDLSRIRHVFDARTFDDSVSVIGAGAIGSRLSEQLVSVGLGSKTSVFDHDTVSTANLSSQMYGASAVGRLKVAELRAWSTTKFDSPEGAIKWAIPTKVTRRGLIFDKYVFLCVDSMKSRREIVEDVLFLNGRTKFVFDMRITATTVFAIAFDITDPRQYRQYLDEMYDDPDPSIDAEQGGCNLTPSVAPTASIAASIGCWLFFQWSQGNCETNEVVVDVKTWSMDRRRYDRAAD